MHIIIQNHNDIFVQVVRFDHICFLFMFHLQIPLFHFPSDPSYYFLIHSYVYVYVYILKCFLMRISGEIKLCSL